VRRMSHRSHAHVHRSTGRTNQRAALRGGLFFGQPIQDLPRTGRNQSTRAEALTLGPEACNLIENLSQRTMNSIATALQNAAGTLQSIAETTTGERAQRASVVALVLRCTEQILKGGSGSDFIARRVEGEVASLPRGSERSLLKRLSRLAVAAGAENAESEGERLCETLVMYGCELERGRRMEEATAVLELARDLRPRDAEIALHSARVARLSGDREGALALYQRASDLDAGAGNIARLAAIGEAVVDAGAGNIARLAAIGEAVVSTQSERLLSAVIRKAIIAQDAEAAAVALEERALLRRARGDREGSARDLCFSAWRFQDPVDRARVAHRLADLFIAGGDPGAAREALLLALAIGDESQQEHARGRLHTVSRDLEDQVGQRRWRSFKRPPLVSLSARSRIAGGESAASRLAEWREAITASATPPV